MLQTFGCMNKQENILEKECEQERERAGKEGQRRERIRETETMMEREWKKELGVGGQMKW